MMLGLDFLGLGSRHWDLQASIKAFPQGFALGLFADETFGPNAIKNTQLFLESGKVAAVRAHLHWSYQHKIIPLEKLKKLAPKWESIARAANIPIYISHSCEYSESNKKEVVKRVSLLEKLCPSCFIVESPMHSPVSGKHIIEQHGTKANAKPGDIVSTDGQNLCDINAAAWVKKNAAASIIFGWGQRFNLSKAGPTIPAPERKATPSVEYIKQIVSNLLPKGELPPFPVSPVRPIKDPLLYKVMAEDTGDARGNRPLVMLKGSSRVQICTISGDVIGEFVYFGNYPNGTKRFYSGLPGGMKLYGYQIAEQLKQKSGTEWGFVKQGGVFYGPVHFAFRVGYYQK